MHSINGKPGQELWHSEYALGQHCIYEKDMHMTSNADVSCEAAIPPHAGRVK